MVYWMKRELLQHQTIMRNRQIQKETKKISFFVRWKEGFILFPPNASVASYLIVFEKLVRAGFS